MLTTLMIHFAFMLICFLIFVDAKLAVTAITAKDIV